MAAARSLSGTLAMKASYMFTRTWARSYSLPPNRTSHCDVGPDIPSKVELSHHRIRFTVTRQLKVTRRHSLEISATSLCKCGTNPGAG